MACKVSLALYAVVLFAAVALTTISVPIDQFRFKKDDYVGNHGCITLFGFKPECYKNEVLSLRDFYVECNNRDNRLYMAAFFSLLALFMMAVAFILGLIQLCCCHKCMQWICLLGNMGSAVCGAMCIALLVDAYSNYALSAGNSLPIFQNPLTPITPQCQPLGKNFKFGAGFALLCSGFGLNVLSMIFLLKS